MRTLLTSFALLLMSMYAFAANPVHWEFEAETRADGTVAVLLHAKVDEGWHIYALSLPRDDGPLPTEIHVQEDPNYVLREVVEPNAKEVMDNNFGMRVRYHSGEPTFTALVDRRTDGSFTVRGTVEYMVCNDNTCLPPVAVPFEVAVPASTK
ncbi:MAG: hypothetical protein H6597_02065 [Flavobacteriales bacterium]|nr:hypothetical protein [Flavobacteriales bacterium]MCB9193291.1 hypothetical protein [Flavobacteriales bacterium]